MREVPCAACDGARLKPASLAVTIGERSIAEVCELSIGESAKFLMAVELTERERLIAERVLKEIKARLRFLVDVGLAMARRGTASDRRDAAYGDPLVHTVRYEHDRTRERASTNGEPDTADNNANTLLDYDLIPIPCRFLTTSTNWFLAGIRFKNDLLFFTREGVKTSMEDDFDRMAVKIRTYQRFAVGVREFIYLVGNPGA